MTLGLQLNCSSTIKRSLNALQFHGDTVKMRGPDLITLTATEEIGKANFGWFACFVLALKAW